MEQLIKISSRKGFFVMKISIGGYSFFNTQQEGKMDIFGYLRNCEVPIWFRHSGSMERTISRLWLKFENIPEESYFIKVREALG